METTEPLSRKINDDARIPHAQTSEEAKEMGLIGLFDFLILLAQQRRSILKTTLAALVLGVIAAIILPPRYTATVTILPPQQSSSTLSTLAQVGNLAALGGLNGGGGGGLGLKNQEDMYVSLMKSQSVEDAVIERFGLKNEYHTARDSDTRKKLESHTQIDGSNKDGLIRISVSAHAAERARDLANGYLEAYQHFSERLAIGEASQRRAFFERQLEDEKNKLAQAEESLKQTEQSSGAIQIESQARVLIESAANLRAQIAAKEVEIESIETYAGAGNTDLIQARRELEGLQAQLQKLTGSNADNSASMLVSKGAIPQTSLEYVRKVRDVKYHETLFEILARQFETAKLDEAREGALIQVVDAAITPDRRSSLSPILIVLAFAVIGVFVGILFVLSHHTFRILQADELFAGRLASLKAAIGMSKPSRSRHQETTT